MKKILLTMLIVAFVGSVYAQNDSDSTDFPDVPAGSYAADAVSRIAELGIVIGYPDGEFKGNESFTRYQAALVVSRLLDYIDQNYAQAGVDSEDIASLRNAVQELSSDLDSLSSRVSSLESSSQEGTSSDVQQQIDQLSAELESLRAQIDSGALQGPQGPEGPQGPQGPEGPQGPQGPAGEGATVQQPAEVTPQPTVVSTSQGGGGGLYFGVAALNELNDQFGVRGVLGVDKIVGGFGLRATFDYNRQSEALFDGGTSTVVGHLTYTLGGPTIRAYIGAGVGNQFGNLIFDTGSPDSLFASGLLGAEYDVFGGVGIFVEGMVDYYFTDTGLPGYQEIYPTVAAGLNVRF